MIRMKPIRRIASILCLFCCGILCACSSAGRNAGPVERTLFAMDTFVMLTAYGEAADDALTACASELQRLEGLFSATQETSDIARLNASDGTAVAVDDDTAALLQQAIALSAQTGGAFDPTVYPLMHLWGFGEDPSVPDAHEIESMLTLVGAGRITLADGCASLPTGMGVDLGGIAKGYAADKLSHLLADAGVESALLSLGGNVSAVGCKPDGSSWRIAVRDPADETAIVGVVEASDLAVVTSGGYQRYFEQDGVRYHHILDPDTGYPADSGLASSTVIASSGTKADALSTALFVMGPEDAIAYWREYGSGEDGFSFVLVTDGGEVLYSENAPFSPTVERSRRIVAQPAQ